MTSSAIQSRSIVFSTLLKGDSIGVSGPLVSAVIPTYNYARYVAGAVESVFPVLRGPRDRRRRRRIHRRDGRYPSSLARSIPLHRGLAAARNTGIRVARGPYVAFLDSDDLWLLEKVSAQIARLDGDPAVGLVYGEAALFTETSPGTATLHSSWAHHPSGKILPWLVRQNVVPSPTPMVRRELFDQVGPFDETLSACEDWDMWIRIARAERRRRSAMGLATWRRTVPPRSHGCLRPDLLSVHGLPLPPALLSAGAPSSSARRAISVICVRPACA
jgi:glycosyltransferase involved in cell wall biosynthesis